ncbi:GNAT family N-acetyltransferase [Saccharothrix longispora]|uniref:GNAT family N-acetyltransferase n=1 Tax=Saccharothrix longispora TaxID=33920 RepID=UPI0028FD46FD|nr:GNAT family N-acetyltransferase [Saccharothrix longispora]MDU0289253.1 GNAT family N-acetyltransferase [Saccharothrix longispora]
MSASLHLAVRNATALTTALARARGHELVSRPGFLAMNGEPLLRVLVRRPDPTPDDLAELALLVGRARARVVVEDSFSTVDGGGLGLTAKHMPVMLRHARPVPPPALEVVPARTPADVALVERVVVDGFPLTGFPPGGALPAALLDAEGVALHLARRDGEPAGACLTVAADHAIGVYWLATLPAHRSRGVGRALLHAVLADPVPATLTATDEGLPLYCSLGFEVVTRATWWSN